VVVSALVLLDFKRLFAGDSDPFRERERYDNKYHRYYNKKDN
jgi:hypothetical protein